MTNEELTSYIIDIKSALATLPAMKEGIDRTEKRVNEINSELRNNTNATAKICQWQEDHEKVHRIVDEDIKCLKNDSEKGKDRVSNLRVELAKMAVIGLAAGGGATGVAELIKQLIGG